MSGKPLTPLTLIKQFCISDYAERNAEKTIACLSTDIHWFGTSDLEDVHDIGEARAYIEEEIATSPSPYHIMFLEEKEKIISDGLGSATVKIRVAAEGLALLCRVTAVTKLENGRSVICEMHTSVPDGKQKSGEYFPSEFIKEHETEVVREFVDSMIPGNFLCFYLEPEFPLAMMNQPMLLTLGYRGEEEYQEAIGGKTVNGIHPEDRRLLEAAISEEIVTEKNFRLLLRFRKSDGSYLWTDVNGIRSRDNRDREIMVCLCLNALASPKKDIPPAEPFAATAGGERLSDKQPLEEGGYDSQGQAQKNPVWNRLGMAAIIIAAAVMMVMIGVAASAGMAYLSALFAAALLLLAAAVWLFSYRMAGTGTREREFRDMLLQLLSENVDSVFFIYDGRKGVLDFVSENIDRMLGIDKEAFVGSKFLQSGLMPEDEQCGEIKAAIREKRNFSLEYSYQNPGNGKTQLLRLSGYVPREAPWQDKWIFCMDDRTDEVLKERRLEQAVHDANKANKAKSEFLANMSHDIRTPMNGIIGMTQLALMENGDVESMRDYMQKISRSSEFLLTLINDVLDMSKIESGKIELKPTVCSVKELRVYLESVIQPLCAERGQKFTMDLDEELCFYADKQRLSQILINLLSNASKYTAQDGEVALAIHARDRGNDKKRLTIYVEDNGIGMTQEFQKRMFQPFAQENREVAGMKGTGLGLAIVKKLVDLMHGSIRVESNVGRGSRFIIELDVSPAAKEEVHFHEEDKVLPGSVRGIRVLLCEDNDINQEIIAGILKTMELDVELAKDGKEGVTMFSAHEPGYYRAILMDCRMPVMDGYEATRAIRALKRPDSETVPVIALTADAFEEDRRRCMEAGMNDFLAKPVEVEELKKALARNIFGVEAGKP